MSGRGPGERLFRLLLRCYPRSFRDRYGDDMLDFYRDRRAGVGPGLPARLRLWRRLVSDALSAGAAERLRVLAESLRPAPSIHRPAARRSRLMTTLLQDLRLAVRGLRRTPGFSAVVVITLALGIGANTAIFTVLEAVLLRPLPYHHAERVRAVWNGSAEPGRYTAVAAPEYLDYREQLTTFDAVAAFSPQASAIVGAEGEPDRVAAYLVTPNLFDVLGAGAILGRTFRADDGIEGGLPAAVLSHALWRRRFGSDSTIIGRDINVGGRTRTVVGVMAPEIRFPDAPIAFAREQADLWLAVSLEPLRAGSRGDQNLAVVGRLRPGATAGESAADLAALSERFRTQWPDRYGEPGTRHWSLISTPLRDQMIGSVRPALVLLATAVGIVLLIACINVTNLLLARGSFRQREVAVRLALGSSRGRLLRQLVTESVVLSVAGGAIGLLLAWAGTPLLLSLAEGNIPRLAEARVSVPVLAFTFGISVLTGIIVGAVPAFRQSRGDLRTAMTDGSRGASDSAAGRRVRSALVAGQVALALVVLVAAGLLGRSLRALLDVDPGFSPRGVVALDLSLPRTPYDSAARVAGFWRVLSDDLARLPGVEAASVIYPMPMSGESWNGSFEVEGLMADPEPHASFSVAGADYFRTMRIRVVAGREFTAADRADAPGVAVIDEHLAARYWPGQSALGRRIRTGESDGWRTVVGVVRHVHLQSRGDAGEPQLYFPVLQRPQRPMVAVVRARSGDGGALTSGIRQSVSRLDPNLPTTGVALAERLAARTLAPQRFNALLIGVFAAVALGLASVGLYGMMAFWVAQRTRELGIRLALGGQPGDLRRMVVREGLVVAGLGLVAGGVVSVGVSRLLAGLLFGVPPVDPPTYLVVAGLLLAVAIGAAYAPARRATRIDPTHALRE